MNGFSLFQKHQKQAHKIGLPPGTMVYTGSQKEQPIRITLIDYTADEITERQINTSHEINQYMNDNSVTWINIDGIHEISTIQSLGSMFKLHPLVMEDIVNPRQRSKIENYDTHLFMILKMVYIKPNTTTIHMEQTSFVLTDHVLLTFQEEPGDVFESIRERIRTANGRIRKADTDYLMYALIDAIVDQYFTLLEHIEERMDPIEEQLFTEHDNDILPKIHSIKRDLNYLRKTIWPLREMLHVLVNDEYNTISPATTIYFRDVYDHVIQIFDTLESYRDTASGMQDIYLTNVSNRMNSVMKVLTMIATIFIPLSFIAGIFGMNFDSMPELKWNWAYPAGFWGLILAITVGMILFFKHKKWF